MLLNRYDEHMHCLSNSRTFYEAIKIPSINWTHRTKTIECLRSTYRVPVRLFELSSVYHNLY